MNNPHSVIHTESTVVTLRQEGIIDHSWTKARLSRCCLDYHRWLYIRLKNTSNTTHNVIYCGPEISTDVVGEDGADCFWFLLRPGARIRKVISGYLGLYTSSGFKIVNWGGVEAIDNHPVPGSPERLGHDDNFNLVIMSGEGGSYPSPGGS